MSFMIEGDKGSETIIDPQFEPPHDKTNKMTVCPASTQSDQSLYCALIWKLRTQGSFMRTAKTLIRLGGCRGWSESSLGAHVILLVFLEAAQFIIDLKDQMTKF